MSFQLAELATKLVMDGQDVFHSTMEGLQGAAESVQGAMDALGSTVSSAFATIDSSAASIQGAAASTTTGLTALRDEGEQTSEVFTNLSNSATSVQDSMDGIGSSIANTAESLDSIRTGYTDAVKGMQVASAEGQAGIETVEGASSSFMDVVGQTIESVKELAESVVNGVKETWFPDATKELEEMSEAANKANEAVKPSPGSGKKEEGIASLLNKGGAEISKILDEEAKNLEKVEAKAKGAYKEIAAAAGIDMTQLIGFTLSAASAFAFFVTQIKENVDQVEDVKYLNIQFGRLKDELLELGPAIGEVLGPAVMEPLSVFADKIGDTVYQVRDAVYGIGAWIEEMAYFFEQDEEGNFLDDFLTQLGTATGQILTVVGSILVLTTVLSTLVTVLTSARTAAIVFAVPLYVLKGIKSQLTLATSAYNAVTVVSSNIMLAVTTVTRSLGLTYLWKNAVLITTTASTWLYQKAMSAAAATTAVYRGAIALAGSVMVGFRAVVAAATSVMTTFNAVMAIGNIRTLGMVVGAGLARAAQVGWNTAVAVSHGIFAAWNAIVLISQGVTTGLSVALKAASFATRGLGMAIKGALAASGVGLVLVLIAYLIQATGVLDMFSDSWRESVENADGTISALTSTVQDTVFPVITKAYEGFLDLVANVIEGGKIFLGVSKEIVGFLWGYIEPVFNWLTDSFKDLTGITEDFSEVAGNVWDRFLVEIQIIGLRMEWLFLIVSIWLQELPEHFQRAMDYSKAVLDWFGDNWKKMFIRMHEEAIEYISSWVLWFFEKLGAAYEWVKVTTLDTIIWVSDQIIAGLEYLDSVFTFDFLVDKIIALWDWTFDSLISFMDAMKNVWTTFGDWLKSLWDGLWNAITGKGFTSLTEAIDVSMGETMNKIKNMFSFGKKTEIDDLPGWDDSEVGKDTALAEKDALSEIRERIANALKFGPKRWEKEEEEVWWDDKEDNKKKDKGKDHASMSDLPSVWRKLQEQVAGNSMMSLEDINKEMLKESQKSSGILQQIKELLPALKNPFGVTPT